MSVEWNAVFFVSTVLINDVIGDEYYGRPFCEGHIHLNDNNDS